MELIFGKTTDRHRCDSEVVVNGFKAQCTLSTSGTVTIPTGLHYFDGKLDFSESMLRTTISICRNHEMRLKIAFQELLERSSYVYTSSSNAA